MPTMSKEQIIEVEIEMAELLEQLAEARQENLELKAQISRLMSDRSMTV